MRLLALAVSSRVMTAGGYSHWSHRIVALSLYSARLRSPCSRRRKFDAAASNQLNNKLNSADFENAKFDQLILTKSCPSYHTGTVNLAKNANFDNVH